MKEAERLGYQPTRNCIFPDLEKHVDYFDQDFEAGRCWLIMKLLVTREKKKIDGNKRKGRGMRYV